MLDGNRNGGEQGRDEDGWGRVGCLVLLLFLGLRVYRISAAALLGARFRARVGAGGENDMREICYVV